jgi:murein DD-endopeptidase MepM/ murein hydrolase activator NlpD
MAVLRWVRAGIAFVAVALLLGPATPAAGAPVTREAPPPAVFGWPLDGTPTVVRPFDPPPVPWLPGHRGVDLAASPGTTVRAAGPGVVHFAGMVAGRPVVSIDHPNGLRTTYEPVTPTVDTGQPVNRGDPIGVLLAGHPDCAAVACLHWGLRHGDTYLDPLSLLGRARVRLLPLAAESAAYGRRSSPGNASASRSYSSARL